MSESATEALDLLRFVALAASVHADAVQCAVDDTRRTLLQMSHEEATLRELEATLDELQQRQARVHAMRDVIARSQRSRAGAATSAQDASTSRIAGSVGHSAVARKGTCEESDSAAGDGAASGIDAQVAAVRQAMRELDANSVKTKLLQLETLKRRVGQVDAEAVVRRQLESFRFPAAVEQLWRRGDAATAQRERQGTRQQQTSHNATSAAAATQPSRTQPVRDDKASLLTHNRGDLIRGADDVDRLLKRACRRFVGRYEDALDALADTEVNVESDPALVLDCLLYVDALTATDSMASGRTVNELQTLLAASAEATAAGDMAAAQREALCCSAPAVDRFDAAELGHRTVLSPHMYCALPARWPSAQLLTALDPAALLPPARHILSARFSCADATELRALTRLRIQLQRSILDLSLDTQRVLAELLRPVHARLRDTAVAAARVALLERRCNASQGDDRDATAGDRVPPHAWTTMIAVVGEDETDK